MCVRESEREIAAQFVDKESDETDQTLNRSLHVKYKKYSIKYVCVCYQDHYGHLIRVRVRYRLVLAAKFVDVSVPNERFS